MQSYLQGLITGILLVLTFLIFSAKKKGNTRIVKNLSGKNYKHRRSNWNA